MAHVHCRRRTRALTWIRIPNPMATLYYAEHVHVAQTQTRIPTPYFCVGQESESESVSGSVNEPLELCRNNQLRDVTLLVHEIFLHQFSDVRSRFYACNV